ncbi:2-dehydropantoate 2-reductase [candidate division WOR-3 bacterium]|nr:2-dehydropantoate 2-reductase [candidate division WOR-3 bacterium]
MKIAILGIGGVGGYLGARLCYFRKQTLPHQIIFIQRGEGLKAIKSGGVTLKTENHEYRVHPDHATDNPAGLGMFSHVFVCVKSYHLDDAVENIRGNIDDKTVIISMLNGINMEEKIRYKFPFTNVLGGCIYVSSQIVKPGLVRQTGSAGKLFMGSENSKEKDHRVVLEMLNESRIKAEFDSCIKKREWDKFLLLSPFSTISAYYDCTSGDIVEDPNKTEELMALMKEIKILAEAQNVAIEDDTLRNNFELLSSFDPATKTSFQRDLISGGKTELDVLAGYVVKQAKTFNLELPNHKKFYAGLLEKIKKISNLDIQKGKQA